MHDIDFQELQRIIKIAAAEAAEQAVKEALSNLCRYVDVDLGDVESVRDVREDFRFARKWRKTTEKLHESGWAAAINFIVAGVIGLILVGVGGWLHSIAAK